MKTFKEFVSDTNNVENVQELFITKKTPEQKEKEKKEKIRKQLVRLIHHVDNPSSDVARRVKNEEYFDEGNPTTRMLHKSKTQVTGHISADRGSDEPKNRKSRKSLESDLQRHGIGYQKGVGEYKYSSGEGTGREVSLQTSKPGDMSKRKFGKIMRRLGRKHGQESVITKDTNKPAKLHTTEKGSKVQSVSIGKSTPGKHPQGYGETSGTKIRGGKLPKKTTKPAYHYGEEDN